MSTSTPPFGVGCPDGGNWYACGNGLQFLGCCDEDPCNDKGCPTSSLRIATFDAESYGQFADQSCEEGQWFVCQSTDPPFLGCCASNACGQTDGSCPAEDLKAASLSTNVTAANQFDPDPPLSASSSTTSTSSVSSTSSKASSSTSATASTSSSASATPVGSTPVTKKPAFIGALASVLGAIVVLGALWWWAARIKASRKKYQETRQLRLASAMSRGPDEDEDDGSESPAKVGLIAKHSRPVSTVIGQHGQQQQLATPIPNTNPWNMSGSVSPASPPQPFYGGRSPPNSPPMYELSEGLSSTNRGTAGGVNPMYKAYVPDAGLGPGLVPTQAQTPSHNHSHSRTSYNSLVYQQIPQTESRQEADIPAELAASDENKRDGTIHDLGIRYV